MADEIDQANEQADRWLQQSIEASRLTGPRLLPMGQCHNCERMFAKDSPDIDKKLFCDSECADEYADYVKQQQRR